MINTINILIFLATMFGVIWVTGFVIIKSLNFYDSLLLSNDHNELIGLSLVVANLALGLFLILALALFSMHLFGVELPP